METIRLCEGWLLSEQGLAAGAECAELIASDNNSDWMEVSLPCDVHMPLIKRGIIPDPVIGDNCFQSEWIEDRSWWFKREFDVPAELYSQNYIELVIGGLDAEADIFLNGSHLCHHKSAFYPYCEDVKKYLKQRNNLLLIRLTTGVDRYSKMDIRNFWGAEEKVYHRGDMRRIMVRKPQYCYGWDWGPRAASCGITGDVTLNGYKQSALRGARIFTKKLDKNAIMGVDIEIENLCAYKTAEGDITVEILNGGNIEASFTKEVLLRSGINHIEDEFELKNAKWWWPNGMGSQNLYTARITLNSSENKEIFFGVRTVELCMDKINEDEREFKITVNGVKTFCKGGNWIPCDSIYARVTDDKIKRLIEEAKEANFNMLRVWGGGLYEFDSFYEECDKNGIMIWHDFMFSCAMYPDHLDWFSRLAESEINYQTKRLRNHPSIILWSGCNENNINMPMKIGDYYGGAKIYNLIAPELVRKNCPDIPYWNGSPYGGEPFIGGDFPNYKIGDCHFWGECTMNPDMEKRITPEEYDKITAKFISEYGYIGPCCKTSTFEYYGSKEIDKTSLIWSLHTNTFEKSMVAAGIQKHYVNTENLSLDEYILYAGLCQGLMYGYSLEAIRIKPDCGGSLFWMYNDCWGEVGWTIIDYYLRRKPSYYFVKRSFEPVLLSLRKENNRAVLFISNDTGEPLEMDLSYGYISFDGAVEKADTKKIAVSSFSRTLVMEFDIDQYDTERGCVFVKSNNPLVLPAVLRTDVFRNSKLSVPNLTVLNIQYNNKNTVFTVKTDKFAHAVHFNLPDGTRLSDEYFDLLPNLERQITIYDYSPSEEYIKAYSINS